MRHRFFTLGHSDRSFDEFLELLTEARIELVLDVRRIPMSRHNPQFNANTLSAGLASHDISYEHVPELGGLRGPTRAVASTTNAFWINPSFHNYADYALSERFRTGLEHLIEAGHRSPTAIMCSEAVWWRCHRRIVTDYLLARSEPVFHIMAKGRLEAASLTRGAVVQADGSIIYPSSQTSSPGL